MKGIGTDQVTETVKVTEPGTKTGKETGTETGTGKIIEKGHEREQVQKQKKERE